MRNLALLEIYSSQIPKCNITATVVDPEEGLLWAASERLNADSDLQVKLWIEKAGQGAETTRNASPPSCITTFSSATNQSISDRIPQIASLSLVMDDRSLVLVVRGGDIATMKLDDTEPMFEVVGSVEDGILAAAWSPDSALLALVTGDGKLILMTSTFDILFEAPLNTEEFGEDAPINVGWGSKQTQFHGSLGKAAAQTPSPSTLRTVGTSSDDDHIPRISWRGDGSLFVVSSLSSSPTSSTSDALRHRILRIYNREGALQSSSEPVAGLEHTMSWRPSGNLIVGTQRFGSAAGLASGIEGRHDVVFFEKNGLRHGEFTLREQAIEAGTMVPHGRKWGYRVRETCWSPDSNVLAIWIEGDEGDVVQLWTIGNYHWYLKQEVFAPLGEPSQPGRFTSVGWHPENILELLLTTSTTIMHRTYKWETFVSRTTQPNDTGSVAVVDGTTILLTPFRTQNVPPPMSSHQLSLNPTPLSPSRRRPTPIYASFSPSEDIIAVLWESGYIELWDLHTRLGPGAGKVIDPEQLWSGMVDQHSSEQHYKEIAVWTAPELLQTAGAVARISVLCYKREGNDVLQVVEVGKNILENFATPALEGISWRFVQSSGPVTCWHQTTIFEYDMTKPVLSSRAELSTVCHSVERIQPFSSSVPLYIGLSASGTISTSTPSAASRILTQSANSFHVASGLIVYTTTAHEAHFVSASDLLDDREITLSERRRIERGSKIVTAVPSTMSLVLQMPRGNLETINPRPMVMKVVKANIDAGSYRKAFLACRKHRIDLNVIFDHNPRGFRDNLTSFVEQVDDVDYINLFLASLGSGSQSVEVVAELCDLIREELERRDLKKYVNSILTAYVVKRPPAHEAGLGLLLRLRDSDPTLVEEAVKYIIFLADADTLFDTALGMYDFTLVLMIAQHAQKDPREYLPFLRELRALQPAYQHFRIDDHLKRYPSALKNLCLAGTEHFDEAMSYVEKHQLYESALSIWRKTDQYHTVLSLYGEWLFERRDFKQAAIVFIEAEKASKAMVAYEKSLQWRELFELAGSEKTIHDSDVVSMAYRVADDLTSKKRNSEASTVLLDYAKDVREAVVALVHGSMFSEARRIATLHARSELIEEIIYPSILEARAQIAEDLGEMREQLRKQAQRLRELRIRKIEEPESYYGAEDTDLHNVDVMTDASQFTAFTRYTVAPSTASRTSKRSSRSKRKMERKVGSGRKGTVDEEEYLLKSITKLVGKFTTMQDDTSNLIPHLLQFTTDHRTEARLLQNEISDFESELKKVLREMWIDPLAIAEGDEPQDSWAIRMEEKEKDREKAIRDVVKPELKNKDEWKTRLIAIGFDENSSVEG